MIALFTVLLVLIAVASFTMHFLLSLRTLRANEVRSAANRIGSQNIAGRYLPMLRLLDENDLAAIAGNKTLLKSVRARRRQLFRGYLSCLAKDYARLLGGLRLAMVQSGVDRPDLLHAIGKNRTLFALAMCKVQYRLALHAAGIGSVDISGLVAAYDLMRNQVATMQLAPVASAAA